MVSGQGPLTMTDAGTAITASTLGSGNGGSINLTAGQISLSSGALIADFTAGSGHGRDFLWSWLREARAAGVLVLAPTSVERTWSIMGGEDVDAERLAHMLESVAARYPIDRERLLLTGMSDGGP